METSVSFDVRIILNIKEGKFYVTVNLLLEILFQQITFILLILGKGFEQILLPTLVVATLNGHSLETDVVEPSPNPQYDLDLVWEVDKNRLRKYVNTIK